MPIKLRKGRVIGVGKGGLIKMSLTAHQELKIAEYIFKDPISINLFNLIIKVAKVDSTVLITGETGVGKEVIANMIHKTSLRSEQQFVRINCTTLPDHLLESELFGYERGAFTGALKEGKPGLIEIADQGTILLDEIADLPFIIQGKLLRFLQEQEIYKLGSIKPLKLNVRVIAATNRDLQEMVLGGKFRKDLFYRLSVIPISVPPLRERPLDIEPLIDHFLTKYNSKYWLAKKLAPEIRKMLIEYSWPGNVRELGNLMERLIVTTDGDLINFVDLPKVYQENLNKNYDNNLNIDSEIIELREARNLFEKNYILKALKKYKSIRRTAKVLGVDHSTIVRKLKQY